MSQDNIRITISRQTRLNDFWFRLRIYRSLKTSKSLAFIFTGVFDFVELHTLSDNSKDIFNAVAFLQALGVTALMGGESRSVFVMWKTRVAQMKVMSVPKLELQEVLLAAQLKNKIIRKLTATVNQVFMWTGSTTVLQWINSTEMHPMFVANRVCYILEYTSVDQWKHAATNDNPADGGTRWMSAEVLSSWVIGPHFLTNSSLRFVPKKHVIYNITLGSNKATFTKTLTFGPLLLQNRQLLFFVVNIQKF